MNPPFSISWIMLSEIAHIERSLGRIEGIHQSPPQPHLRKSNRVKTVQGSLAIEGNTLSLQQVTALLDGKLVLGDQNEIREVLNANEAYEQLEQLDPFSEKDLLKAHQIMMADLIDTAGSWRSGNVGIMKQGQVSHIAPKAGLIPYLMSDLFTFMKQGDVHPLIASCVFHYELEFIHPFEDGNGRIGRFWHSLLLYHYHSAFKYIPVESLIKEHQNEYYETLEKSDQSGESTAFVEFSLSTIRRALQEFLEQFQPKSTTPTDRLKIAKTHFNDKRFSRNDYLKLIKTISTATASRDLKLGVETNELKSEGEKSQTIYQFKRTKS